MTHTTRPHHPLRAALVATVLATAHAVAEPVADPTRPPGVADSEPRAAKPPRSAPAPAPAPVPVVPPKLQAVQVAGIGGASSALVDGRVVRIGERLGDATVTAIDRGGLTLRGPRGELQRLPLLNGITQTASRAEPPADAALATGSPQDTRP